VVAFAVSYTYSPSKNNCDQTCSIAAPPTCNNQVRTDLIDKWRADGKKVLLSFGGAGMGGSWSGDQNNCWDYCFGKENDIANRLVSIIDDQHLDGIDLDYEYCYDIAGKQAGRCSQRSSLYSDAKAQRFLDYMTFMLRTKLDALQANNGYNRGRYEIAHAPMDSDLTPNSSAYFQILKVRRADLDFLLPQLYNGVTRAHVDGIEGSGAGALSAASIFESLSNDMFDFEPDKIVFGFCIADCAGTGSNVNGNEAVQIMKDLKTINDGEFGCNGGAFFWVAFHDQGGTWSDTALSEVRKTAGCTNAAPSNKPTHSEQPTNIPPTPTIVITADPTANPTTNPTKNPTNVASDITITVSILTDSYPGDTSWTLVDTCPGGGQVGEGSGYANSEQLYSSSYATRSSRFEFSINDVYGDGICCLQGSGSYTVYMDNVEVALGGNFSGGETKILGQCNGGSSRTPNPTSNPTKLPTRDSCVTLQVEITTDNYPRETSWSLSEICAGEKRVAEGSGYTVSQLHSTSYCVPDGRFRFKIEDGFGDGICCAQGEGGYIIKKDGVAQVSGGEFRISDMKEFGSCGPADPSEITIRVEVLTDDYPGETSWTLRNACPGGGEIAFGGEYTNAGQLYSSEYVTSRGRFELTIEDTWGDGICCSAGSGSYNVFMDNAVVASGEAFGSREIKSFGECDSDPEPPSAVTIKVDILTDNHPEDTTWTLTDTCPGGGQVGTGNGYSSLGQLYSTDYVTRNSRYQFDIFDTYGDGICCSTGKGSFNVYMDSTLVASGGVFSSSQTKSFGQCDTASASSPYSPYPLGMSMVLEKPLIDCTKLEITRCKAVDDVCEWRNGDKNSGGIFVMSSLQKTGCFPLPLE